MGIGDLTILQAYAMRFFKPLKFKEFLHLDFNFEMWHLLLR